MVHSRGCGKAVVIYRKNETHPLFHVSTQQSEIEFMEGWEGSRDLLDLIAHWLDIPNRMFFSFFPLIQSMHENPT